MFNPLKFLFTKSSREARLVAMGERMARAGRRATMPLAGPRLSADLFQSIQMMPAAVPAAGRHFFVR